MGRIRNHHNRTSSNYTEVANKLFFNESYSTVSSMRQAAKKFVETNGFDPDCLYYKARMVNNRWVFTAIGTEKCIVD